jgi:hypothetical protein
MEARQDDRREFVARQYASLLASGVSEEMARTRLREVLGDAVLGFLGHKQSGNRNARAEDEDVAVRLADTAAELGGSAADARAAFVQSIAEARLFAVDWWRPVRTFLLYISFLLALATIVAAFFAGWVLPVYRRFDGAMGTDGGAAGWILSDGAIRLFGPLVLIALLVAALAFLWYRMARCMARLQPFAGLARFPWLYGRSGIGYHALLCLEYAATLRTSGVPDDSVLAPALRLAGWPSGKPFGSREGPLGERLQQAERLGTFADELDWQRRLHWSSVQSQLELSRDRLILFSRVVFYLLIGYMVTVLYLPVFSLASTIGVPS